MAVIAWICFSALGLLLTTVIVALFVEERGLQVPRMYDERSLRPPARKH